MKTDDAKHIESFKVLIKQHALFFTVLLVVVGVNFLLFGANLWAWRAVGNQRTRVALLQQNHVYQESLLNLKVASSALVGLSIYSNNFQLKSSYDQVQKMLEEALNEPQENVSEVKALLARINAQNQKIYRALGERRIREAEDLYQDPTYKRDYDRLEEELHRLQQYSQYRLDHAKKKTRRLEFILQIFVIFSFGLFCLFWVLFATLMLRIAKELLNQFSRVLSKFSVAIRSPLSTLLGRVESLFFEVEGPLNEQQKSSVGEIYAQGKSIRALFLDLTQVEALLNQASSVAVEPMDLVMLVNFCIARLRKQAEEKEVELVFQPNLPSLLVLTNGAKVTLALEARLKDAMAKGSKGTLQIELTQKEDGAMLTLIQGEERSLLFTLPLARIKA